MYSFCFAVFNIDFHRYKKNLPTSRSPDARGILSQLPKKLGYRWKVSDGILRALAVNFLRVPFFLQFSIPISIHYDSPERSAQRIGGVSLVKNGLTVLPQVGWSRVSSHCGFVVEFEDNTMVFSPRDQRPSASRRESHNEFLSGKRAESDLRL